MILRASAISSIHSELLARYCQSRSPAPSSISRIVMACCGVSGVSSRRKRRVDGHDPALEHGARRSVAWTVAAEAMSAGVDARKTPAMPVPRSTRLVGSGTAVGYTTSPW